MTRLAEQLGDLGVEAGGVLLVHASFRAIRPVEGGPTGLIAALHEVLGPDGTLVMPSWGDDDGVFDPARTPVAPDLGIVARIFATLPDVVRSEHPFAFAASGRRAAAIVRDPLPLPPHRAESPAGRVRDLDGQVLLLGVDHDADTTIHLGEVEADVPYRLSKSVLVERGGAPVRIEYGENDHCCRRFALVGDWLAAEGLERVGPVGHGTARLCRSRDVVRVVVERLRADPTHFLHPSDFGCAECDEAWSSIR